MKRRMKKPGNTLKSAVMTTISIRLAVSVRRTPSFMRLVLPLE